jgi:hypothetical protein
LDYTQDAGKAAEYWARAVQAGQIVKQKAPINENYLELHYEDIVNRPEEILKKLFTYLREPWDPVVLNYHRQKRNLANESSASQVAKPLYKNALGRWEKDLNSADKNKIKAAAGNLLIDLGYAKSNDW